MAFDRRREMEIVLGNLHSVRARMWEDNLAKGEFMLDEQCYVIIDHQWEDTGPKGLVLHVTYLAPISQHAHP